MHPSSVLLKEYLLGTYLFKRTIDNPTLTIFGTAHFTELSTNCILCVEQGSYTLNDRLIAFGQKRFFVLDEYQFKILDANQKMLHEVLLSQLVFPNLFFSHTHECNRDYYEFSFEILDNQVTFKTHYQVKGPFKNYAIHTNYYKKPTDVDKHIG